MGSTTNAKKEVIDFLWEWAQSHGDWSKLLLNNILTSSSCLSQQERLLVFQYFKQSINLHKGLPTLNITKPKYNAYPKSVKISMLSEVTGVNKLAKDQSINFSPNMTVIYGENGTGKTGYSRILKALGFSYETSGLIYPNIYNSQNIAKSAKISFEANGIQKTFTWDGSNRSPDLESISVFNNHCVAISLADRQLVVTPIGFELFSLVTDELNNLSQLLNAEKSKLPINDWLPIFNIGTPQHAIVNRLSKNTSITELEQLADFDDECANRLEKKKKELLNLNKALIENTIKTLKLQIADLDAALAKTDKNVSIINANSWNEQFAILEEIKKLQSISQKGLKDIVKGFEIEQFSSPEFLSFITSADRYLKILANNSYPSEDSVCIYCRQELNKQAQGLLTSYKSLLNDTTQIQINKLNGAKNHFKAQVAYINTEIKLTQASWGYDEQGACVQPNELLQFNRDFSNLKQIINDDKLDNKDFIQDSQPLKNLIEYKRQQLNAALTSQQGDLDDIANREKSLTKEINELKDRKALSDKYLQIIQTIENYKILDKLNANANEFNTRSISLKTTEAREELVKHNFNEIFKKELSSFRKSHLNIDLNFATDRGNSKVQQRVKSHLLADILSEGEQKAISLSEFLTELQLDNTSSTVIFDDPVNSLDHHLIDDYARRVISLSKERQVIIFTHSILLFNSLLFFSDNKPQYKGVEFMFYNSKNEFDETGFISSAEELNSIKSYIGKINVLLGSPKNRPEVEMAEDGYGFLRSAIETCVESEILGNTVRRYQKNVALSQFIKVDGQKLDANKEKLNEIFERCCGYIKGHSNPKEIHNDPTLIELKDDFEVFKAIRNLFVK